MFFVRIDEKPRLQLLRCGSAGARTALLVDLSEKPPRRKSERAHLPIAALIAGRKQCRPEATVNECHFPADKLCVTDVVAGVQFLESPEDLLRSRMRPPRSRNPFARDDPDRAWQDLI